MIDLEQGDEVTRARLEEIRVREENLAARRVVFKRPQIVDPNELGYV